MTMLFRPTGAQLYIPGVEVLQPRAAAPSSNWWDVAGQTCVAAYAPRGAADLAASYINLANPGTNNAAPGVAPTFDTADGWTFNGTNQYLTTGAVPAPGWSMIVRFNGMTKTTACGLIGAGYAIAGERFFIGIEPIAQDLVSYGYAGFSLRSPRITSGVLALGGAQPYRNGSADGSSISGTLATARVVYIGAANGSISSFAAVKIQALAIYSTTLSGADVASLTTEMNLL